ncbi:MAG: VCBS repeat-containing protein [Flammeovirgaceae bacterium]|nr:MAG: VCBS repeat-containing protein [Flammeovirgaceae bacterium]
MARVLLIIIVFACLCAKAIAQITSTFDIDAEGWTCSDNSLGSPLTVNYNASGGNPGGYISAGTTSSQPFFWTSPAAFGGNVAYFCYGQELSFDLQLTYVPTTHGASTLGDVQIRTSSGQILSANLPTFPAQAPAWSNHTIRLDETAGWRVGGMSGPVATKAQLLQYLSSVHSFRFSIDYTNTTNNTFGGAIDNVVLNQRSILPAPLISSLSTTSANPGTSITINGSNFDPTLTNNTVFFGGMEGSVTSASPTTLTVTVPSGAHYGPIRVVNKTTGRSGISRQPFVPTFDGGGRIIPASFKLRFSIDHTGGMGGLLLADIDGDGWNDIVVANEDNTGIRVYRNLGNGGALSAASFATPVFFPTLLSGTNGAGLAVRDFDNDGKLDMVTSGWTGGPGAFATFRNISTPGNLSFEAVEHWNGASDESPVTSAEDIDGDGLIDLVGGEGSSPGSAWIIQNISTPGNIEFSYRQVTFIGGSISHQGATLADLDGDGKPEFIHKIQNALNQQNIHVNSSTPGAISFGPALTLPVGIQGSMVVYDFNKDGKNDLAWKAGFSNDDIYIRLNTNSGGPLSISDFSTQIILDSETGYYGGLSMTDINGDGNPDLLATDSDKVGVFENNYSAGSLDESDFIKGHMFPGIGATTYPTTMQAADLNGDGKPDMVFGTTNTTPARIVIYENQNVSAPVISVATVSPLAAPVGATVTITGDNFAPNTLENYVYFGGIQGIVLTASSTLLTVSVPPGVGHGPVSVRVGELTSVYHLPFHPTFSSVATFDNTHFAPPVEFALANADYDIEVADLDNDNKPDVAAQVSGTNQTAFFINSHATGPISTASLTAAGTTSGNATNPKLFDIDGNGLIDVVGLSAMFQNNSTPGLISFGPQLAIGTGAANIAQADFNSDGKIDLAKTHAGSAQLLLLENRSTAGTLSAAGMFGSFSGDFSTAKPSPGGGIAAADFDADGFPDVIATNPSSDNLSIFPGTNATRVNASTLGTRIDIATGDNPGRVYTGDFDDDNKLDFLIYHGTGTNPTLLSVFHNQSTPGSLTFNRVDLTNPSATTVAHVADLDGDGKPEIITVSESGNRFSIFKNIYSGGALTPASFASPFNTTVTAPRGITTGDLNEDGAPEIILTRAAGFLLVYQNLIATPTISSFSPASGPVGTLVTITGTNFSAVIENNIVEFNGVSAYVTSSTSSTLTAIVPPGATTGPITVLVLGNTATSATDFTVVPFDCPPTSRTGGALDTSFNPAVEDPADFTTIAMQSNGKSIVATTGIIIGGTNYEGILRFNQDGTVDNTFTNSVYYPRKGNLLVLPDDKILVVESGTESYVRRLNPDGSLDNSFNSPAYYASTIYALGQQSDGKVLLSIYDDGVGQVLVYRLNADGTPDGSFAGGDNMASNVIRQQTDGKIVLGGSHGLARLDQFGNADPSFQEVLFSDDEISDLIIQPDGKIVIVGTFNSIHGVPCENIARLNPDGSVDLTFTFNSGNGFDGPVRAIKRTADGNMVAAGQFSLYNDEVRHQLALLNPDGNLVCEFDPVGGVDTQIRDLAIQPDGKILIVGDFVSYDGTTIHGFARVLYTSGASITITTQPGGTTNRCEGDNYPFSTDATGTTNITYQWQKFNTISSQFEDLTNGGAYADVTTKNLQINNMQLSESGDYRCRIDGDLASTVYTDIATLIVNPLPPAPITTDGARCGPGPVIVSAANGSPGDYRWYPDLVAGEPIPGEENDTYTTPALTVTTQYYVSLVNAFCESARVPVNAIINSVPPQPAIISSITPVGNTITFCSTNTLTLTAPTGYATYSWSSGETTEQITVTASGLYSVTVTNATGCSSPASVALTVNIVPAPCNNQAPVIQSTVAAVPVEGIITINVLDLINDPDDNLDPASLSVVTSTSQQGASASINGSLQLVLDYGGVFFSGTDQVTIQVCDLFGECTQQVLTIEVAGDIIVYNAFSPNGDGKNEIFLIQYINLFPDTQQNRVTIFNRWGDEVFSISNYDNDTRVFRGISNSGKELTTGTYFYKIEFNSGRPAKTGFLSLKR